MNKKQLLGVSILLIPMSAFMFSDHLYIAVSLSTFSHMAAEGFVGRLITLALLIGIFSIFNFALKLAKTS